MATSVKPSNLMKVKPNFADGPSSSKSKIDSSSSKKTVVERSTTVRSIPNSSKMVKKTSSQSKVVTKTKTVTKTREKKVYSLAGQKYDVPEEREPLRIFYESLSKQIPSSEMAEFWMMEHGLLSPERAKRAFEKKQRKQKQLRTGTPIKSPPIKSPTPSTSSKPLSIKPPIKSPPIKSPPPSTSSKPVSNKPESSKRPQQVPKNGEAKAKKRVMDDSDDDDDFVLSHKRRKG
ncbi:hypothetical protein BUALT_Bualt10G0116200 [Buddleja alternifolia]|uniref:Uncharacterized protein n=1 Tax=Buddleja alternifolia TaxID=168488 RepID=A0AAV6X651_9LAMI|nr:hypothetical protein BUALT_Bualt10G0116200 [Buddleja alternifolia]